MAFATRDLKFIVDIQRKCTQIIKNQEELTGGIEIYGDRDYGSVLSADDFTASDLGITKAQFTNAATFANAFNKFLNGVALDAGEVKDYKAMLNILRTDYEKN